MRSGQPSQTALAAARHRAVHQVLEDGRIFADPLAWQILGEEHPEQTVTATRNDPHARRLRLFIAARHRFAEDCLSSAVDRGTRQLAVLGAGLDTFAYRNPYPGLVTFEVDHPDTADWKRRRLQESGIALPRDVVYVAVDFEREDFIDALTRHGFDRGQPAFFMWLGVVPYLTRSAVTATLRGIASVTGAEVVFDYAARLRNESDVVVQTRERLRTRTAAIGEPLQDPIEPEELHHLLAATGFASVDDLASNDIRARIFGVAAGADQGGGHLLHAAVSPGPETEERR
ncbi:methyltransferase (TIGR00027 family) [Mycobacterium sp. OAS707]|uniref:class I SAM-dependent methyltransferase n=1 Tax=Mycobacterium sp. OAS707 TaxID=2663822 RepID=UPI00178936AE|nr:methyltransferase (TIGR00027 family) [Mycobacterium sp. OAS707]